MQYPTLIHLIYDPFDLYKNETNERFYLIDGQETFLALLSIFEEIKRSFFSLYNENHINIETLTKEKKLPLSVKINDEFYLLFFEKYYNSPLIKIEKLTPRKQLSSILDMKIPSHISNESIISSDIIKYLNNKSYADNQLKDINVLVISRLLEKNYNLVYEIIRTYDILSLLDGAPSDVLYSNDFFKILKAIFFEKSSESELCKIIHDIISHIIQNIEANLFEFYTDLAKQTYLILLSKIGFKTSEIGYKPLFKHIEKILDHYINLNFLALIRFIGNNIDLYEIDKLWFPKITEKDLLHSLKFEKSDLEEISSKKLQMYKKAISYNCSLTLGQILNHDILSFLLDTVDELQTNSFLSELVPLKKEMDFRIEELYASEVLFDYLIYSEHSEKLLDFIEINNSIVEKLKSDLSISEWLNLFQDKISYLMITFTMYFEESHNKIKSGMLNKKILKFQEMYNEFIMDVEIRYQRLLYDNYPTIINENLNITVASIQGKISQIIDKYDRIFLIVVDGLSYPEWNLIKEKLNFFNYSFVEEPILSMLPSITEISRRCIYGGNRFDILSSKVKNVHNEGAMLSWYHQKDQIRTQYSDNVDTFLKNLGKDIKLNALLIKAIDKVHHFDFSLPKSLFLEISGIIAKQLQDIITAIIQKTSKDQKNIIIICSDHGMSDCIEKIDIPNPRDYGYVTSGSGRASLIRASDKLSFYTDSRGNRYRLTNSSKDIGILVRNKNSYFIPREKLDLFGLPHTFNGEVLLGVLIAKDYCYFNWSRKPMTHGGLTLEETVVPLIYIQKTLDIDGNLEVYFKEKEPIETYVNELSYVSLQIKNNFSSTIRIKEIRSREKILKSKSVEVLPNQVKTIPISFLFQEEGFFGKDIKIKYEVASITKVVDFNIKFSSKLSEEDKQKVDRSIDKVIDDFMEE